VSGSARQRSAAKVRRAARAYEEEKRSGGRKRECAAVRRPPLPLTDDVCLTMLLYSRRYDAEVAIIYVIIAAMPPRERHSEVSRQRRRPLLALLRAAMRC